MNRFMVLDSSPLSGAAGPHGRPMPDQSRAWIAGMESSGIIVVMPGIIDYEVGRKLLHLKALASLKRLDGLRRNLDFRPTSTAILDRAAELWADARRAGLSTSGAESLDVDCILAAHALEVGGPGDLVTVATSNRRHLGRYPGIDARDWISLI